VAAFSSYRTIRHGPHSLRPSALVYITYYIQMRWTFSIDVRYIGDHIYVASLGGLHIFDVSDPTHPTQFVYYNTINNNSANGYAVDVEGNHAYLAVGAAGLLIFDVSVPTTPQVIASIDTPGLTIGVQVVGSKAYLADQQGGLQVVDLQTPSQPHLVGALDTAGYVCRLSVVGNLAYLADSSGGLIVADVSQTQPVLHGFYGVGGGSTEMAVVGDRLYISSYEGVVIADISTPNRPRVLGTLVLPGFAYTIVASGTTIFLGNDLRKQNNYNDWQVTAVDVVDPTAPHILSTVTFTAASVMDLALVGTTLYVATGNLVVRPSYSDPFRETEDEGRRMNARIAGVRLSSSVFRLIRIARTDY
jgi:hypothetical protein